MKDRQGNDNGPGSNGDGGAGPGDSVTFDHYDWSEDRPSISVAEAVAAVTNQSVTALPPLQETADADALDALVGSVDANVRVTLSYADATVTITGDGTIEIATD